MNISASAQPLPSTIRPDAAQDPARTTLGPDGECADPASVPDDGLQVFGRMLSQSLAKDGPSSAAGRRDAVDGPAGARPDLVAIDPARSTATKAADATADAGADAAGTTAASDAPNVDDLAAQIALVSQWAAVAAQPAAVPATPTTGRVVPSLDGTDIKSRLDAVRGAAGAGATTLAKGAASGDGRSESAAATASDPLAADAPRADVAAFATPLVLAGAGQALERSMRTTAGAATSGRADEDVAVRSTTGPATARAAATASIERLIAMASGQGGAGGGSVAEQPLAGDAFASQVAPQVAGAASATAAPSNAAVPTIALHEQVGTTAWSHEVGHAALRMAANDLQNVSLRMNPEHLGPVEVQLRVDQGVAHLQFTAAHADTRHALESSRTTLDQLFSSQGLKLGDCSVGQQSAGASFARDFGAASQGGGRRGGAADAGPTDDHVATTSVTARTTRAVGLVDTFA